MLLRKMQNVFDILNTYISQKRLFLVFFAVIFFLSPFPVFFKNIPLRVHFANKISPFVKQTLPRNGYPIFFRILVRIRTILRIGITNGWEKLRIYVYLREYLNVYLFYPTYVSQDVLQKFQIIYKTSKWSDWRIIKLFISVSVCSLFQNSKGWHFEIVLKKRADITFFR